MDASHAVAVHHQRVMGASLDDQSMLGRLPTALALAVGVRLEPHAPAAAEDAVVLGHQRLEGRPGGVAQRFDPIVAHGCNVLPDPDGSRPRSAQDVPDARSSSAT